MSFNSNRCKFLTVLAIGFLTLTLSALTQAQSEHGGGISKTCGDTIRVCTVDNQEVLCDDELACTDNVCDTSSNTNTEYYCTFSARYLDDFLDTLSIVGASDEIDSWDGPVTNALADLFIVSVTGNAGCTGGVHPGGDVLVPATDLMPCWIGPAEDLLAAGRVTYVSRDYFPDPEDLPGPLSGQAQIDFVDQCDGLASTSCPTAVDPKLQTAVQNLETGCTNPPTECPDDNNACTEEICAEPDGCQSVPVECPPDPDACNEYICDEVDGCVTVPVECPPDPDACNEYICDDVDGCVTVPVECPPDPNACNEYICDDVDGCVTIPIECPPNPDECNTYICDDVDGCVVVPIEPVPDVCLGEEICRTPGFWGARGGDEKGQNITQAVIDMKIADTGTGLDVCGVEITNTAELSEWEDNPLVGDPEQSAIEAICVSVKGDLHRQLVRQIAAAQLNCALGDCTTATEALIAGCNDTCFDGSGPLTVNECIAEIDCWNNGGHIDSITGMCIPAGFGECSGEGFVLCETDEGCNIGDGETCVIYDNCHDADLCPGDEPCAFEPPGPASSPKKCNAARKNSLYVAD